MFVETECDCLQNFKSQCLIENSTKTSIVETEKFHLIFNIKSTFRI